MNCHPCFITNPDLWEVFNNVYKSVYNFKPRCETWAEAEVNQFLSLYKKA